MRTIWLKCNLVYYIIPDQIFVGDKGTPSLSSIGQLNLLGQAVQQQRRCVIVKLQHLIDVHLVHLKLFSKVIRPDLKPDLGRESKTQKKVHFIECYEMVF